jgi:hypothetical protein
MKARPVDRNTIKKESRNPERFFLSITWEKKVEQWLEHYQ